MNSNKALNEKLREERISRRVIYEGDVLNVVRDEVRLPNGSVGVREMCLHVGAVCIIPLLDDETVLMERQYRYAHERVIFEIPAGKLNYKEEPPLEAAKRELREETGAIAKKFTYLGELIPTPAIVSERIQMFLAEDISFTDRELDEDEFLEVERVPLKELYDMAMRGEISDAKTLVTVLKVWQMRHPSGI